MSAMKHNFVPLLPRDQEHPMHKQHSRLSIDTTRYANMRGTYFVRHIKGNSVNQIQKLADNQVTRTKVAHAVVYAKKVELDDNAFASDDTSECRALWDTATDNVFEFADKMIIVISNLLLMGLE
jgi:hypothetical protein